MQHILIAFAVLFVSCAVASTASAQNPCQRVLFHAPPANCPPGSYETTDQFRARMDGRAAAFRAQEERELAYKESRRYWLEGPAADVRCGIDPYARFCTYHGRQLGWSRDDWSSWGSSYYGSYRYGIRDYRFYRGIIWRYPHADFPNGPPGPPIDTRAPRGYHWDCDRDVFVHYCGYVRKGSDVFRSILVAGALTVGIVALANN